MPSTEKPTGIVIRMVCYRAFCDSCVSVVSAAPRTDRDEAESDLAAHMLIVHEVVSDDRL